MKLPISLLRIVLVLSLPFWENSPFPKDTLLYSHIGPSLFSFDLGVAGELKDGADLSAHVNCCTKVNLVQSPVSKLKKVWLEPGQRRNSRTQFSHEICSYIYFPVVSYKTYLIFLCASAGLLMTLTRFIYVWWRGKMISAYLAQHQDAFHCLWVLEVNHRSGELWIPINRRNWYLYSIMKMGWEHWCTGMGMGYYSLGKDRWIKRLGQRWCYGNVVWSGWK